MDWTIVNAALFLVASIVALAIVAVVLRRFARQRGSISGIPIRIIARQPLAPKATLVIVDVGDKRLLLGVTEQSINLLGTLAGTSSQPFPKGEPSPPNSVRIPTAPAPAELSFRAYLSSLFQRSTKDRP